MSKGAVVGAVLMAAFMLGTSIFISAPAQAAEVWESMDDMPFQTYAFSTAQLPDGRVFFNGGIKEGTNGYSDETWLYNTSTDNWENGASAPIALVGASAVAMPDGRVYLFCGQDLNGQSDHDVLVYDVAADSWSTLPSYPDLGSFREAAAMDDTRILIAGGLVTHPMLPVDQCLIFDISLEGFYPAETLPYAIGLGSLVKAGDSLYYIGGYDPSSGYERSFGVLRYHILSGHWEIYGQMSEPVIGSNGVLAADGLVHLYGILFGPDFSVSRALDLRDCSFRPCPLVPVKSMNGGIVATDDGRLIVFGGEHEDVVSQEVLSLTLFEKEAWLGTDEAGPGETVRIYVNVDAVAAGPEGMTAQAYLLKDGVTYGSYDLIGVGNGTASALMTLPEDLEAGEYRVHIVNVDLGVGVAGMLEFQALPLTVTNAPSPTDRIGELQDQLNDTQQELAELQESMDELQEQKMDAMIGYIILIAVIACLLVGLIVLIRKK